MENIVDRHASGKRYKPKKRTSIESIYESDNLKEFRRLMNKLPIEDLEDVILYVKIKDKARRSNGAVLPPSAEVWMRLPYWLKLKIFLGTLFYEQVFKLKNKLWFK